jgi:retron-type reverse transcriptase
LALFRWLSRLLPDKGRPVEELARRIGVSPGELQSVRPTYREFNVPRRSGARRPISAPDPDLKRIQKLLYTRLLKRLPVHEAVHGFVHGRSIVTNALPHRRRAVVINMDIEDFFPSTSEKRLRRYFRKIGWSRAATDLLARLTTCRGGLPQGAPTSPCLSNVVNMKMDARLAGLARSHGGTFTRYADDITISLAEDSRDAVRAVVGMTRSIVRDFGYHLHEDRKLHIARRHQQQRVTGLVVNEKVQLPRELRRRLRAVEHHLEAGLPASMTREEFEGWQAVRGMIARQSGRA